MVVVTARPTGRASGRRRLATLRISVSLTIIESTIQCDAANTLPDEYTALQKYISTYRDPKAHDPNAEVIEDDVKQPWYKFGSKKKAAGADPGAVPDEMLEADIKQGISSAEVEQRRKRYGWNEITTEKENLFIKFLGFFTGPVLYGKLISLLSGSLDKLAARVRSQWLAGYLCVATFVIAFASFDGDAELWPPAAPRPACRARCNLHDTALTMHAQLWNSLSSSLPVFVAGSISVSLSVFFFLTLSSVGTRKSRPPMSSLPSRVTSP